MNKISWHLGGFLAVLLGILVLACSRENSFTGSEDVISDKLAFELRDYTIGCTAQPDGLISWWPGEGAAADIMDGNGGEAFNGVAFTAGKVNQAFSFDGADDRISLEDAENLKLTTSLTIEAWAFIKSYPSYSNYHAHIFFRGDDRIALDPYYVSVQPDGKLRFHVESLTAYANLETPIELNQFLHLAAVLDDAAGTMKIYVNGNLAAESSTTVRPFKDLDPDSNPGIGIGNHGGNPFTWNQPFNGLIDELSIYSRALSAEEILSIFNAGTNGKCTFIPVLVDIMPGSMTNPVNPGSNGVIPVAILTTASFDATTIDPLSVEFGPNGAKITHRKGHIEDVDGDGDKDLLLHFRTQETGIGWGDTEACLSGSTFDGEQIQGCDVIQTGEGS